MAGPRTFRCTPGTRVAASRRRLRRLLLGLAGLMIVLAIAMFATTRWGPGLISLGAALLAWFAWHMSGDLDPLWLTLDGDTLSVQMRRQRQSLPLRSPRARRLDRDELAHLESLTSASGVVFATASYESHRLGAFDLYATDLERAVLVEVEAPEDDPERDVERWVVTPDDPEGFLAAIGS